MKGRRLRRGFLQRFCGISHQSLDSKGCSNPQKPQKHLMWHDKDKEYDGKLRHLSDSSTWKLADHMCPNFSFKPRNLRLALSTNGINPHKSMSSRHSCWPDVLIIYNLPP